jgi:hypothetical protein
MTTNKIIITHEEDRQYRQSFADYPEAVETFDLIQENSGDLLKSASLIAIEYGEIVTKKTSNILDELAHKYRDVICSEVFINDLIAGLLTTAIQSLLATSQIPIPLAITIVVYLTKTGVKRWCDSGGGNTNNL